GVPQGVSVFFDGIPVNEPDALQLNFDLLPLAHVTRVEMLAGTASVLGPNSLGGALNLVTRRGGGPPVAEISATAGSYGTYEGDGRASGSLGDWSYYAGGAWAKERGWR